MSLIELRDVKKLYRSGAVVVPALNGVNMRVEKGEYVAIVGPSGSGKSTLLGLLGLLSTCTSGSFHLAGHDVSNLSFSQQAKLRNQYIGLIFQSFNLISSKNVLNNVLLPLKYSKMGITSDGKARALGYIERVGLSSKVTSLPSELSGGQQQRVAIARALVTEPALILADEPTGNLDSATSSEIIELMEGLHGRGSTLLVVTHNKSQAKRADRVIEIADGVVQNG